MPVYADREEPVNQGDLFVGVPFAVPIGPERQVEAFTGMVISHHCDCDKFFSERDRGRLPEPERFPIAVAPIYEVANLEPDKAGNARAGNIRRFFYLPAEEDHPERVADLWFEQPVPMTELLERERIASLSDEYVKRLHIQIWEIRTRTALPALEQTP